MIGWDARQDGTNLNKLSHYLLWIATVNMTTAHRPHKIVIHIIENGTLICRLELLSTLLSTYCFQNYSCSRTDCFIRVFFSLIVLLEYFNHVNKE